MPEIRLLIIEPNDCHTEVSDSLKYLLGRLWPSLHTKYVIGSDSFDELVSLRHDIVAWATHIIFTSTTDYRRQRSAVGSLDKSVLEQKRILAFYHNANDLKVQTSFHPSIAIGALSKSTRDWLRRRLRRQSVYIYHVPCLSSDVSVGVKNIRGSYYRPNILICGQARRGKGITTFYQRYKHDLISGKVRLTVILTNSSGIANEGLEYLNHIQALASVTPGFHLVIHKGRIGQNILDDLVMKQSPTHILESKEHESGLQDSQTSGMLYLSRRFRLPLILPFDRFREIEYAYRYTDRKEFLGNITTFSNYSRYLEICKRIDFARQYDFEDAANALLSFLIA